MSLKDQNKPAKVVAFFLLALLYSWVLEVPIFDVSASFDGKALTSLVSSTSLIFLSLSLASLALDGLFPKKIKETVVHRRLKNPLPGSRAFSQIAQQDTRIDLQTIKAKYGPLPSDPLEQNQVFYKIYKTCAETVGVKDAHKSYLLFRDLAFDAYILSILATFYTAFLGAGFRKAALVLLCGVLTGFLLSLIATNFASRFVSNVLAQAK